MIILTHGALERAVWMRTQTSSGRRDNTQQRPRSARHRSSSGEFDFSAVFVPGSRVDMIVPFPLTQTTDRYGNTLAVMGRMKPGVYGTTSTGRESKLSMKVSVAPNRSDGPSARESPACANT